jgi:hypothetical protein
MFALKIRFKCRAPWLWSGLPLGALLYWQSST